MEIRWTRSKRISLALSAGIFKLATKTLLTSSSVFSFSSSPTLKILYILTSCVCFPTWCFYVLALQCPRTRSQCLHCFLLLVQKFLSDFLVDLQFLPRQIAKIVLNSFTSSPSLRISSFSSAISPHAVKTWSSLVFISSRRADITPPTTTCSSSSSVCEPFSLSLLPGFLSALSFPISGY